MFPYPLFCVLRSFRYRYLRQGKQPSRNHPTVRLSGAFINDPIGIDAFPLTVEKRIRYFSHIECPIVKNEGVGIGRILFGCCDNAAAGIKRVMIIRNVIRDIETKITNFFYKGLKVRKRTLDVDSETDEHFFMISVTETQENAVMVHKQEVFNFFQLNIRVKTITELHSGDSLPVVEGPR